MPKATVNTEGVRIELKNCPGAFVVLQQLSFGLMLKRRDMAMRYQQELNPRATVNDVSKVNIDFFNEVTRQFDFAHCIIDHNLEDDNGNKLDLSNKMALDILDPRIAAEIEREIDKLNTEDFDGENFTTQSVSQSTATGNGSQVEKESNLPATT